MIRNLLAFIGLLAIAAVVVLAVMVYPKLKTTDPETRAFFKDIATKVAQGEAPADAMLNTMLKEDTDPAMRDMYGQVMARVMKGEDPTDAMLAVMLDGFDPGAPAMYKKLMTDLLKAKDPATAMTWAIQADEGLTVEDVKESMKSLATSQNLLFVSESPFYKQAEAVTGQPYRHVAFMSFCDVRTGMQMADYNNAFTAMMPCTISVTEHENGEIWIYAMNVDFMIHGGKEFSPELKASALSVRDRMWRIMEGAAHGEF